MILTERDQARFWAKVSLPDGNGCMLWLGSRNAAGYGRLSVGNTVKRAHRVSCELAYGPIPDGLVVDHLCRVPACVAPRHLEAVTHAENTLRGMGPTAINANKTHCNKGHEFTPENMYKRPDGERRCRACTLRAQKIRQAK